MSTQFESTTTPAEPSPLAPLARDYATLEQPADMDGTDVAVLPLPQPKTAAEKRLDFVDMNNRWKSGLDWTVVVFMSAVHLLALGAIYFFTWKAVLLCVLLNWLTGGIGICLGFHRMLTHGSFQTYRPVRWFIAWLGQLAGQGSAIVWVANHRKHHMFSDKEGDPHSPHDGPWWSHLLWFTPFIGKDRELQMAQRYAPDLLKDPMLRVFNATFLPGLFLFTGALFLAGYLGWDAYTGWSFVFWGILVRLVWTWHVTWLVNSATHMWGYRNYETTDDSRNLWWVGLLSYGEGWHNNHHAYQRMAKHGHKWWEFDITYLTICAMEKLGLAWNVVHDHPPHQQPA